MRKAEQCSSLAEWRLGGAEWLGRAEWRLGGAAEAAELCGAAELLGVPLTSTSYPNPLTNNDLGPHPKDLYQMEHPLPQ